MTADLDRTPADELPAQPGGAKALLLTILGEFVLPAGGAVWTSSLVAAATELGIAEKNARQAIARIGDQGLIENARHGRSVRWSLAPAGLVLLESGARRIYGFGRAADEWEGEWIVAHCTVAESQRTLRTQLRTRLGFLGFGELSASLFVSPHVDREPALRATLDELGLLAESIVLRSTSITPDADVVARAWDLSELGGEYRSFVADVEPRRPSDPASSFRAVVELVHGWRRFPFLDPELPERLLPEHWVGARAAALFHDRHAAWSTSAQRWFADLELEQFRVS